MKEYKGVGVIGYRGINKGVSFYRNCGASSVGVLPDNLVSSTGLIM